ncbi:hypothetical protein ACFOLL_16065 [Falsochrobactrum ovis]|uniref:Uncharacterized protein n=1 Tax=Falsochrobactrum ovis TaxID=1293442 RepID=A0A364JWJ4_9HYPH|nr:hypothetical protein [Falsochrobactrum ovis]RAK30999.1 hypothetical protein C7374_103136 [Falsochrobactrum ovis]
MNRPRTEYLKAAASLNASAAEVEKARQQMSQPSTDWSKLANILRRSGGGSSRTRSQRF